MYGYIYLNMYLMLLHYGMCLYLFIFFLILPLIGECLLELVTVALAHVMTLYIMGVCFYETGVIISFLYRFSYSIMFAFPCCIWWNEYFTIKYLCNYYNFFFVLSLKYKYSRILYEIFKLIF